MGLIERWKSEYFPIDECRLNSLPREAAPATLNDSQGAFILLGGLTVVASILLLIEMKTSFSKYKK